MNGFRPGRAPTLTMLVAVAAGCTLGSWQVRRLHWRTADLAAKHARIDASPAPLQEVLRDPAGHDWRRTALSGRYVSEATIFVGPVTLGSVPGARVLTPLRLDAGEGSGNANEVLILVDRGFVPGPEIEGFRASDRPDPVQRRTGVVRAFTRAAASHGFGSAPAVELAENIGRAPAAADAPGSRRHWLRFDPENPAHVAAAMTRLGDQLAPILVQLDADPAIPRPVAGFDRPRSPVDHRGYALIWFASAAACFAAWVEFGRRRAREMPHSA